MGWFFPRSQRGRLLREIWRNPWILAQELYAMSGADIPFDEPIKVAPPGDEPGIIIDQGGESGGGGPKGPVTTFKIDGVPAGGIQYDPETKTYRFVDKDGHPTSTTGGDTTNFLAAVPPQTNFIGKVISGTGDTYTCWLYPNGKSGSPLLDDDLPPAPKEFTVKVPTIKATSTIPPDTYLPVMLVGPIVFSGNKMIVQNGSYWMQPPVFLYTLP
jgi:hypothetical protein